MRVETKTIKRASNKLKSAFGTGLYRLLENLDGERHQRVLIPYNSVQPIKMFILVYLLDDTEDIN